MIVFWMVQKLQALLCYGHIKTVDAYLAINYSADDVNLMND